VAIAAAQTAYDEAKQLLVDDELVDVTNLQDEYDSVCGDTSVA
jgi:hypothetical protein